MVQPLKEKLRTLRFECFSECIFCVCKTRVKMQRSISVTLCEQLNTALLSVHSFSVVVLGLGGLLSSSSCVVCGMLSDSH